MKASPAKYSFAWCGTEPFSWTKLLIAALWIYLFALLLVFVNGKGGLEVVAVLEIPPVESPQTAVIVLLNRSMSSVVIFWKLKPISIRIHGN